MAKLDKPSWQGDRDYSKPAGAPEDDLEVLIMESREKINVFYDEIAVNTAKTGITSSQASAITANTAKTGISTKQASAITANTLKASFDIANALDVSFSYNAKSSRIDVTVTISKGVTKTGTITLS